MRHISLYYHTILPMTKSVNPRKQVSPAVTRLKYSFQVFKWNVMTQGLCDFQALLHSSSFGWQFWFSPALVLYQWSALRRVTRAGAHSDLLWPWRNLEAGRSILLSSGLSCRCSVSDTLRQTRSRCCIKCYPYCILSSQSTANVHVQEQRIFVEIQESR